VLVEVGDEKKMAWAQKWITDGFRDLEKILAECAGTFAYGNFPTMADFCIVPQVYNANRFNVKMADFPIISRINANMEKLEFAKHAHPDSQIDAVKQ
jgi:glutathione S-transferase